MAKGIASYPKHEQAKVAARRLQSNSQGLGYWSAVDAQKGAIRRAPPKNRRAKILDN